MALKALCTNVADIQINGNRMGLVFAQIFEDSTNEIIKLIQVDIPLSIAKNTQSFANSLKTLTVAQAAADGYTVSENDPLSKAFSHQRFFGAVLRPQLHLTSQELLTYPA